MLHLLPLSLSRDIWRPETWILKPCGAHWQGQRGAHGAQVTRSSVSAVFRARAAVSGSGPHGAQLVAPPSPRLSFLIWQRGACLLPMGAGVPQVEGYRRDKNLSGSQPVLSSL